MKHTIFTGKRKHNACTFKEKLEALKRLDDGENLNKLAEDLGVGKSTVSDWKRNRSKIEQFCAKVSKTTISERQSLKMPAFQTLDEAVYFWYMNEKQKGVHVSGQEIQSYAMKLNKDLGGNPSFVASTGWLNRWKRRHGLKISKVKEPRAEFEPMLPAKLPITIGEPFTLNDRSVQFEENIVASVDVSGDTAFINDDAEHLYKFTLYQPGQGRDDILPEVEDFKEITKRDALNQMRKEINSLLSTVSENKLSLVSKELEGFTRLFRRFLADHDPYIIWDKIEKLPNNAIINYDTFNIPTLGQSREMLNKLIVVKLNGGLGTSMGCRGPKSLIPVRNHQTFLDLTVQQIEHINKKYDVNVPLILMNSFNTDNDTEKVIRKYKGLRIEIYTFNQSCYPRINRDSLLPVPNSYDIENNLDSWYPPGHGDFYASFKNSGLLKIFLERKREYCFISNIDNLGATVDLNILNVLLNDKRQGGPEFVMEITDKTKADVKGGTLIQYEGKMHLLEIAQVPKDHVDDFKSVKCFKYFNTNNLWVKLSAIDRVLSEQKLHLDVIVNNKTLENNCNVIQLETAVGAAVKWFDGGLGVLVPRKRFLPVKKTSDLLLVTSNLYNLRHATLSMSSQRMFPTPPLIKLGDEHFSKVKDFLSRFVTIPDIIELDHLTVSGDVTFGKGVSLKGTVIIIANHGDRIDIPSGAILENKIVSGNLRILDH